jgi:hypothetical protein
MHEFGGGPAWTHKEFEPPASGPLSPDLGAADKVAFRDNADQFAGLIDHWKTTNVLLQH